MDLKNKINSDYNEALKAKDKSKISTYRLILSAIKDLDIANRSGPNKKEIDDVLNTAKDFAAAGKSVAINVKIGKTDFRKGSISI